MDLRYLRSFVAVAEQMNFTKAAKDLYIAQPALSMHIAQLEGRLGVKLFRRGRTLQLTAAGELLLKEAPDLLHRSQDLFERTRQIGSGKVGSLKVGYLPSERTYLSKSFQRFCHTNPDIDLKLFQVDIKTLHELLEHGDVDLGITQVFEIEKKPEFCWERIYSDCFSVIVRFDHPLIHDNHFELADCAKETFIVMPFENSPHLYRRVSQLCANVGGFVPSSVRYANRMATILMIVDAGIGISIVPRHLETSDFPSLRFFNVEGGDANIDVVAAWKSTNTNPYTAMLLSYLRNSAV